MNTAEKIETLFEEVESAIIEFAFSGLRGDHARNWNALRIKPDGTIYTSEEPSACYSESEYYNRVPHTLTILAKSGDCFTPDPTTGWAWKEDDHGDRIAPHSEEFGFDGGRYERVEDMDEEELSEKLASGWMRFSLDLSDWGGDQPDAENVAYDWKEKLQAWIDAGNFQPA